MRRGIWLATRLYPAAWRRRYEAEFGALLEEVQPGWRDLWDILRGALSMQFTTWNLKKFIALCGVAGLIVAAVVALRTPNRYVSTAVLSLAPGAEGPGPGWKYDPADALRHAISQSLSRSSLATVIQEQDLYPEERRGLPLEDIVETMRNQNIHIAPVNNGRAFMVSFAYDDAAKAQQVTRVLSQSLMQSAKAGPRPASVEVLDAASLPERAAAPNRPVIVGVGLAIGLGLGLLLAGVKRAPLVAAAGFAGAVLAFGLAFLIPDRFVSNAVMRIEPSSPAQLQALVAEALSDDNLSRTILNPSYNLYPSERSRRPITDVVSDMRKRDLRIVPLQTGAFLISFSYPDRYKAQAVVRTVITRLTELNVTVQRAHPENAPRVPQNLEVLDPASLPESPVAPNRLLLALAGLATGLLAGAAFLRLRHSRTIPV